MQTFLPYASFEQTATILDWKRLGKQRLEGMQIIKIITIPDYVGAWAHHPAVKMWRSYENALKLYVNTMITEWKRRGYVNTMLYYDLSGVEIIFPEWLGDPRFLCWLLGTSVLEIGIVHAIEHASLPKHVSCEYNQHRPFRSYSLARCLFSRRKGSISWVVCSL